MLECGGGGVAVSLPLTSTPTGSVRRLGFVRHCVGMMNVGSRVPLLYGAMREGVYCHKNRRRPQSGRVMKSFHKWGDHFPNILLLDLHISILT
jgi:hypothetical protein